MLNGGSNTINVIANDTDANNIVDQLTLTDAEGNSITVNTGSAYSVTIYDSAYTPTSALAGGIFESSKNAWLLLGAATDYGIIVVQDADNSVQALYPTLNKGDLVALTFNVGNGGGTAIFGQGIQPRTKITGKVVPEFGAPGVIEFTTPTSYTDEIVELQ
ncbi:flagellin [Thermococcus celericrescens]|uniref:flagellin n=1 Tax=Thermococcus celericrescens TaxID=227598 RepID=UPI00247FAFEE|nr:flagellin [Thermococcus celericrescens]